MSYHNTYNLTEPTENPYIEDVAAKLAELADQTPAGSPEHQQNAQSWVEVLEGMDPIQWHTIENDMARLSASWPGVLFTIDCKGETSTDLWRVYAKDGMYQIAHAYVSYPEADPEQMRRP